MHVYLPLGTHICTFIPLSFPVQWIHWLSLLTLSLTLLFWFGHVVRRDRKPTPATVNNTRLMGYVRVTAGRMDQVGTTPAQMT